MNATITVMHITWWSLLRILLFFSIGNDQKDLSHSFFYTRITRFSVGVCISRQSELLVNDLSHSVLRLWFHCYPRALFPRVRMAEKPAFQIRQSQFLSRMNWTDGKTYGWLVGWLARPSRTTDPYSLRLAPDARGVTIGCCIQGRDTLV